MAKKKSTDIKNTFSMHFNKSENVVMPSDLYLEQTDITRNVFGLFEYLPLIKPGEIEHLIALINNSPTALSICNKVGAYTVGEGFYLLKEKSVFGEMQTQEVTDAQKAILWSILKRKNSDGDNLLDVCRKAAFDFQALGNAFAQLDIVKGVVFISHQNANFVRPFRSMDFKTHYFGVSPDWATQPFAGTQRNTPQRPDSNVPFVVLDVPIYPTFTDEFDSVKEQEFGIGAVRKDIRSSMLHIKRYSPLMYQWGLSSWISAKHWAELEYRIAKFNVSRFRNGLTTSGLLQVFGEMTDDEKDEYQRKFFEKMTGTENDFKVVFQILENPELKANWVPFENNYTGYFLELSDIAKDRIATAFEIPLSLVQSTPGQLGGNQQIRTEFEVLYNTKIYDIQQKILDGIVRPYLDTVADNEGLFFLKDIELGFKNLVPVSFAGDLDISKVITQNEIREVLGFKAVEAPEADILPTEAPAKTSLVNRFRNFFKSKSK
jgi:hypothetical protein